MRKAKQMKISIILFGIIVLVCFLVSDKIVEGLKNFESPIDHYDKFADKIQNKKDKDYGKIVKRGRPGYIEFSDPDNYNKIEVEQDIKYFNNATNLIMGFQLVENGLKPK